MHLYTRRSLKQETQNMSILGFVSLAIKLFVESALLLLYKASIHMLVTVSCYGLKLPLASAFADIIL